MSDYLNYTLWRQREARMPRELERHRIAVERLEAQRSEQQSEQQLREGQLLDAKLDDVVDAVHADAVESLDVLDAPEELEFELAAR
ncbi:MAG: hypothetical protein ABIW81_08320 [Terrimesophilobacter sp.]